jgi:hypothetical protein
MGVQYPFEDWEAIQSLNDRISIGDCDDSWKSLLKAITGGFAGDTPNATP